MGLWNNFLAIASICMINLVLSGDNAVIIGLAMRDLPQKMQKRAALAASLLAIILRVIFTIFAMYLLQIKFLSAFGGIVLIWITYNLIKSNGKEETDVNINNRFWYAVWTIIIADLSMSFDNVLGVAGVANGQPWIIIIGLVLSIPILILGSTWLASLMKRWLIIVYIGAMILMHTAISMIVNDNALYFPGVLGTHNIGTMIPWIISIPILLYGLYITKKKQVSKAQS